jgi:hypothetical protein
MSDEPLCFPGEYQLVGEPTLRLEGNGITGENQDVRQDRIHGELQDFDQIFNPPGPWDGDQARRSHAAERPRVQDAQLAAQPGANHARRPCVRSRLSSSVVNWEQPWCPVAAMDPERYRASNRESCWRQPKAPSDFR